MKDPPRPPLFSVVVRRDDGDAEMRSGTPRGGGDGILTTDGEGGILHNNREESNYPIII